MKTLSKILLTFGISSILFPSLKSQDFLPGKFRNYQSNPKDLLLTQDSYNSFFEKYTKSFYYDLDKDSIVDVVETFYYGLDEKGNLKLSDHPIAYTFDFNHVGDLKILLDPKVDGLNQNEIMEMKEEKVDFSKTNI